MKSARSLLLVAIVSLGLAQAASAQSERITIAAYNLENFFDVFDNPYTEDEGTDVKPRREVRALAQAIRELDPDVLGINEVENGHVIEAMIEQFLPDERYDYVAVPESNSGRGIRNGIVSRLPIESVTSYRWQTLDAKDTHGRDHRFARDLLHAKLRIDDDTTLDVFVVHLKSKRDGENDPKSVNWRTAEARRIHAILSGMLEEDPDRLIALIGDFNSNPGDPAMETLLADNNAGEPILIDLLAEIPMPQRITLPSTRYPNTVFDYILVSPALAARYVPGSAMVMQQGPLTRGSDHLPVAATFDFE